MKGKLTTFTFAVFAFVSFMFVSCNDEMNVGKCTVSEFDRPAWYNEHPESEKPSFSTSTDAIRLHFYGWGLEEDSVVKVTFPENTSNYRRAILTYRMGGWNEGPSDWDMTTMIMVRDKRTDTFYELVRAFTPYGGSFNSDWEKKYYMDITEYLPMLTGETEFHIYYGGWDATDKKAHTVTLTFDFYDGIPERNTVYTKNIYDSRSSSNTGYRSWAYGVTGHDIEDDSRLGKRIVEFPENVKFILMKVSISGHGHDAGVFTDREKYRTKNAAEFDENFYDMVINGEVKNTGHIFYDNTNTYSQAGTYYFNRANWGPGLPLNTQYWIITDLPVERKFTIDFNLDPFKSKVNDLKGEGVAQYIIQVDIFGYDK